MPAANKSETAPMYARFEYIKNLLWSATLRELFLTGATEKSPRQPTVFKSDCLGKWTANSNWRGPALWQESRRQMKKSSAVVLVLSGALLTGCDGNNSSGGWGSSQTYTNNHYVSGRGYYHAPYFAWYPFPYNYYDPGRRSYYHGGNYTPAAHM